MNLLEIQNLSLSFGGLKLFEDISFGLKIGERVGLIGPNGAGKTTLLNILSGLLHPLAGRIHFLGRDITDLSPHRRICLGIARSFQLNTLFFNLDVLNNVLLAIQGTKRSRYQALLPITAYDENMSKARELLESVGLWEEGHVLVKTLSYGKQRLLEILLALSSKPKLLILDEPSAGLDRSEVVDLVRIIRGLTKDETVLFSAHDIDLVFALADRIMVLYYGKIIAQGTPEDVRNDSLVKEIYLGAVQEDA